MTDNTNTDQPTNIPSSYEKNNSVHWTPQSISKIHALSHLKHYQIQNFNTFNHQIPTFNNLTFIPTTMTHLPLENYQKNCNTHTILNNHPKLIEKPIELNIPIYITSISFDTLSTPTKTTLKYKTSKIDNMTYTNKKNILEDKQQTSNKLIYQMTPSHYILNLKHLHITNNIELIIKQKTKPNTDNLLLKMKISNKITTMRSLPKNIDQQSTIHHPNFLNTNDIQIKIKKLHKTTNYQIPIFLKIKTTQPHYDITITTKTKINVIIIDNTKNNTKASPKLLLDHTNIPLISTIHATHKTLNNYNKTNEISLITTNKIHSNTDIAKCLTLNTDTMIINTTKLITLKYNSPHYFDDYTTLKTTPKRCHHYHTNLCPVNITTQNPKLEKQINIPTTSKRITRFLTTMTIKVSLLTKTYNKSNVHNLKIENLKTISLKTSTFTNIKLTNIDQPYN